jgi:hypothetical protein
MSNIPNLTGSISSAIAKKLQLNSTLQINVPENFYGDNKNVSEILNKSSGLTNSMISESLVPDAIISNEIIPESVSPDVIIQDSLIREAVVPKLGSSLDLYSASDSSNLANSTNLANLANSTEKPTAVVNSVPNPSIDKSSIISTKMLQLLDFDNSTILFGKSVPNKIILGIIIGLICAVFYYVWIWTGSKDTPNINNKKSIFAAFIKNKDQNISDKDKDKLDLFNVD